MRMASYSNNRRGSVLYVTPIMPQRFGNGLAMRAAAVLEALARRFDVHLFVVPVAGDLGPPSYFVRSSTARIGGLELAKNLDPLYALIARVMDPEARTRAELAYPKPYLSRFCTGDSASSLLEWSNEFPVKAVHLMRLYLAPLALPFLRQPAEDQPFCVLDLDDDDARTCRRLMRLYRDLGHGRAAAIAAAEAEKYQTLADRHLRAFDRVIVCSETDAGRLAARFPGAHLAVVPNGYRLPALGGRRRPSELGPLRLLFVGTFGYFPNVDAALFLCREVLPALRRLADREIRIDLVGAGGTTDLANFAGHSEVRLHGFVQDLAPLYAAADVAVVPVRAGGGTRIKVLEAFAHGVPVVTTSLGAEGIDAADGEHLLFADDAEAFARACLRVKQCPELAVALASRAAALLAARHSPALADAAVARVYGHPVVC
jgi:glycosyltransferase involved in cell wall biosynthesis